MGLRVRLFIVVILPIALLLGAYGVVRIRQESQAAVAAERRHTAATARAAHIAVENAMRDRQLADIQRLVSELVRNHAQIDRIVLVDRGLAVLAAEPVGTGPAAAPAALHEVLARGAPRQEDSGPAGLRYLLPVRGPRGGVEAVLEIGFETMRAGESLVRATEEAAPRLGLLVLVVTAFASLAMQRQLIRPLTRLTASIRALGEGRPGPPLPVDRRDELGQVAEAFNRMVEQLEEARARLETETQHTLDLEKQLRRSQALAVAGKLTSALAHEVGTPLNIVSGRAEIALRALPPGHPAREDLATILSQADRISGIIRSLLDSVRGEKPEVQPVPPGAVLRQLGPLVAYDARRRGVALETRVAEGTPPVLADPGQLQQVLLNLLVNAVDATPAGGRITVSAGAQARDGRAGVALTVADTGPGIDPEHLPRIFEPFFTTKPPGQGTGLGLAICRDIARAHGGCLTAESEPGRGARFTLWLPTPEAAA
jgi:signal transduction histidine kinase